MRVLTCISSTILRALVGKLVVNQLMGAMLAAFGESIVLSEALDLSVDDLLEIM